ncbi:MAG: sigma-70 family RNA polymerase sigma factor [Chloracidobacterium sp.]|nr:sigma-70 family RNA polymerase sigma factor [Chloracidobacterium sp.]
MNSARLAWPNLDEGYTDEFGVIYPEVYQAAVELWPQAENFISSKIHDRLAGMRLMLKAAAAVSRKNEEQPDQIRDIKAYLWTTFKHNIYEEAEKEKRYEPLEDDERPENDLHGPSDALSDQILIEKVMTQMDSWTRKVFELRALGHHFEDIAQMLKMRPDLLRSKFHKEIKKLSRRLVG